MAASQTAAQHLCGDAEVGTEEIADGVGEGGVVQRVEHLHSELQLQPLVDGKLAAQGEIGLGEPGRME